MNLQGQPAYVGRFCGSRLHDITPESVDFYLDALGGRALRRRRVLERLDGNDHIVRR